MEGSGEEQSNEDVTNEQKQGHPITVQLGSSSDQKGTEPLLDFNEVQQTEDRIVTAWIKQFVQNTSSSSKRRGELTADETFEAEKYWTNVTQDSCFSHEINLLKSGKTLNSDSKKIRDLKPFLDEDELLNHGAIQKSTTMNLCILVQETC